MVEQRIAVTSSVALSIVLTVLHIVAAGLLWLLPLPLPGKLALTIVVVVSFIYHMARDALLHSPHSIVGLDVRDGAVSLQMRNGEWLDGELLGSSYVSERITIVNFRPRGRRIARRLILLPDNVDPAEFRRLRTWMRWRGNSATPGTDSGLSSAPAGAAKNLTK